MTIKNLELQILVENNVYKDELLAEHGLSIWFKYGANEYLFDTGQGMALLNNAKKLRIDLSNLSAVFISHGHYDHTGGLKQLLEINPQLKVYAHPEIFIPKYSLKNGEKKENGININRSNIVNFIPIKGRMKIDEGIHVVNEIPVKDNFEKQSNFYKSDLNDELVNDNFRDEQVLYIETEKGLVVLLGCSHPGVINILEYINNKSGGKKIYSIIGGMHLLNDSEDKIMQIVKGLSKLNCESIFPLHCTGNYAKYEMKNLLKKKVGFVSTGDHLNF